VTQTATSGTVTHTYMAYVATASSTAPPPNLQATSGTATVSWWPLPRATAFGVEVTGVLAPQPLAVLPPQGGSQEQDLAAVTTPTIGGATVTIIVAKSAVSGSFGPSGYASAQASVADVAVDVAGQQFRVTGILSRCTASSAGGVTASVTVAGAAVAPNTTLLSVPGVVTVTADEQRSDSPASMSVDALHVTFGGLPISGPDIVIAHADCFSAPSGTTPPAINDWISAGGDHTLARPADGTVWAWGDNSSGQLGDGTLTNRPSPVQVAALSGIAKVSAGANHSLALGADGRVWAWGANVQGQLGSGTFGESPAPTVVGGLPSTVAISGGGQHSLALANDGTVWAWGDNSSGQLGSGTVTASPVPLRAASRMVAVAAGANHSLALRDDGTVWAWGDNRFGQLGTGADSSSTPIQVAGLSGVTAIAAAENHSLARTSDGRLWVWGLNDSGQVGDGTITSRPTPVSVATAIAGAAGGRYHSLALTATRTALAWGDNEAFQLGDGTTRPTRRPSPVSVLTGVGVVRAGTYHSVAAGCDGSVWTWGDNESGQLGDGTTNPGPVPKRLTITLGPGGC
jgi:alpha-tubulin suppressor-like RCC1 family protein